MDLTLYKTTELENWINQQYLENEIQFACDLKIERVAEIFNIEFRTYGGPTFAEWHEAEYSFIFLNAYLNEQQRQDKMLTPKTSTSRRTIELDPIVFKELEKHKARQNELKMLHRDVYYDNDFVFAKTEKDMGYPEFIKTIQNRVRRLLRLSGLNEMLTPHPTSFPLFSPCRGWCRDS